MKNRPRRAGERTSATKRWRFAAALALLCTLLTACGAPAAKPETAPRPAAATATPEPTATPTPTAAPTPEPTAAPEPEARSLTDAAVLSDSIDSDTSALCDGSYDSQIVYNAQNTLTVTAPEEIGAVYFSWYAVPAAFTIHTAAGDTPGGENGFLHEYLALPAGVTELTVSFTGYAPLCELELFTPGRPGADVQVWEAPCGKADVLFFPAHVDDDVIFFGPLVAQCVDRGLSVQVAYLVNLYYYPARLQEMLNALWAMGVRNYPILGSFVDIVADTMEEAEQSYGTENVIAFQVEQLRRFQPLVAVGHDREGEYGHGAHRISALALEQSVVRAADASYQSESAAQYGTWDTPKLYLHFAEENPMVLDVDTPLEHFGGKTAYDVAMDAMYCHVSQLEWFTGPILDDGALPRYDCRKFGLVRSLVGADTGNDIMEHLQ